MNEKTLPESDVFQVEVRRPVSQYESSAIMGNPDILLRISRLHGFRRPTTICGLLLLSALFAMSAGVTSVCINSVNRVVNGWSEAHVFQERFKRISPSLADVVTNGTVKSKVLAAFNVTTITHFTPNAVLACCRETVPVYSLARATRVLGPFQKVCRTAFNIAAFAQAIPVGLSVRNLADRLNCQDAEDLLGQVLKRCFTLAKLRFSHDVSFRKKDACG